MVRPLENVHTLHVVHKILLLFPLLSSAAYSQNLQLKNYLDQVRDKDESYQAYVKASRGAGLRAEESQFLTSPQLVGKANYGEIHAPVEAYTIPSDARQTNYSLGVAEQFDFGLKAKLSYNIQKDDWRGFPPLYAAAVPNSKFWTVNPLVEVSFPLWKNLFGRDIRAEQQIINNQGLGVHFQNTFGAKLLIVDAEVTYWKLALARRLVKSSKENLDRAVKLRGWSGRRQKLGLSDSSLSLQADANFELRSYEYQTYVDDERNIAIRFNSLRKIEGNVVNEELAEPSGDLVYSLAPPKEYAEREDLAGIRAELKAKEAASALAKERFKPQVDLVGQFGWNGYATGYGDSAHNAIYSGQSQRNYVIGVNVSVPLDVGLIAQQKQGYDLEEKAAKLQLERKEYEARRDWENLLQRFTDGRERFKIVTRIEEAQSKKLMRERELQSNGRSTLFQVLTYESDLAAAQISRTKAEIELLALYAQLKTYEKGEQ